MNKLTKEHRRLWKRLLLLILLVVPGRSLWAQNHEVMEGYVLYGNAMSSFGSSGNYTRLINMQKEVVHSWTHERMGGYSVNILENGNLLRAMAPPASQDLISGPASYGLIQEIDKNNNLVWEFRYVDGNVVQHHNTEPMPDGLILTVAFERLDTAEARNLGFEINTRSAFVLSEQIIIIDPRAAPGNEVVWKWRILDHIVREDQAAANPDRFSVALANVERFGGGMFNDIMHLNGVSYDHINKQIIFSARYFSEIYIIDASTTTQQAATGYGGNSGKGGRILYRWGNPQNYGVEGKRHIHVVHNPNRISEGLRGAGNILMFNNGGNGEEELSQVLEIVPPRLPNGTFQLTPGVLTGPAEPVWTYSAHDFYSPFMGSVQRLPNGNTFVCEASATKAPRSGGRSAGARFSELTPDGRVVWDYAVPSTTVARAIKYPPSHPGVAKLLDLPVSNIESKNRTVDRKKVPQIGFDSHILNVEGAKGADFFVYTVDGKKVFYASIKQNNFTWNTQHLPSGSYIIRAISGDRFASVLYNKTR